MSQPSPVFDFFPRGTPLVLTPGVEETIETSLAEGWTVGEALDRVHDEQVRLLRTDPSYGEALREAFRDAGVNLVSPTLNGVGLQDMDGPTLPERVRADLARWQAHFDAVPWLRKATTPAQARRIVADGDVGVVLNTQNLGRAIAGDVAAVDVLHNAGLRIAQLTYNAQNLVGVGCTERVDAGLSRHGVEVVERLNDLGVVVDLSHCGEATTRDAIKVSEAPVACTHTFCRSLADHDRGKRDETLRALADVDGYDGVLVLPFFVAPGRVEEAFEVFFDHLDHAISIVGADRVGIGTDFGAWSIAARDDVPAAFERGVREVYRSMGFRAEHGIDHIGRVGFGPVRRYTDWPAIVDGLRERGYGTEEVRAILGGNVLDFWERVEAAAQR